MITGGEDPDTGDIRLGDTVELAYVEQGRDDLDPAKTINDAGTIGCCHV